MVLLRMSKLIKSLLIWLCFVPLAVANGVFRDSLLCGWLGGALALPVSGLILSCLIFAVTWFLLPCVVTVSGRDGFRIGCVWTVLTVLFEFLLGVAGGQSVPDLLSAYNPFTGNLWLLVVISVFLSPVIVSLFKVSQ